MQPPQMNKLSPKVIQSQLECQVSDSQIWRRYNFNSICHQCTQGCLDKTRAFASHGLDAAEVFVARPMEPRTKLKCITQHLSCQFLMEGLTNQLSFAHLPK